MRVQAWTTTVREGHLRAPDALPRYLSRQKLPQSVAMGEQIHDARIAKVPPLDSPRVFSGVDGLITREPHQPLAIFTADCIPLFLRTRDAQVVGILHAGWRGVQSRILGKAVDFLKREWAVPCDEINMWAGPSIGPCCFEVKWDVARHFPNTRRKRGERWTVDLWKALQSQARGLGVRWTGQRPPCTRHTPDFYSYRRDATEKRQVSLILKTSDS